MFVIEIQELKIQKGLALQDILTELHTFLYRCKYYLFNSNLKNCNIIISVYLIYKILVSQC